MSGVKRRTKYRKNITEETYEGMPEINENQLIVKVKGSRGTNLFEVIKSPESEIELAMLPSKFKKLIWIKRNDFLIVDKSDGDIETSKGEKGKVMYNISHILQPNQIKELKKENKWPECFLTEKDIKNDDDDIDNDLLIDNPNHVNYSDGSEEEY